MVVLALKKGDLTHFLYEASSSIHISSLVSEICQIYNGRLKILRIIDHISELSAHGLSLPPEMQGLTDEQISELKLIDEWGEKCIPSGGFIYNRDDLGRRNGKAPNKNMVDVLKRTQDEAKSLISMDLVKKSKPLKMVDINEAIMMLNGALTIVYPMGLPPHEPIRMEFDNIEDLSGTQASMEVIPPNECTLWFCGKEMLSAKCLFDYTGRNEKTRIVIKLTKRSQGAPAREPIIDEASQKAMMLHYYRRQEELKKLDENADDAYLDSAWADSSTLKRQFHGLNDIKWGPR